MFLYAFIDLNNTNNSAKINVAKNNTDLSKSIIKLDMKTPKYSRNEFRNSKLVVWFYQNIKLYSLIY